MPLVSYCTGQLPLSFLLTQLRTTCLGMVPRAVTWASVHELIQQSAVDLPTGPSDLGSSSPWKLSSQMTLGHIKLIKSTGT